MTRQSLNDLAAFVVIAEQRSFTAAARKLEVSPSALSHAMRTLEERLGVRLLVRTTRSVAPTEAGERLLATVRPALDDIGRGLASLRDARDLPSGTVRVTAVKHAVETLVMPVLPSFSAAYPDIRLVVDVDDGLTDIVAAGYDLGIRFAGSVHKDMISVRVGPELAAAVVAAPGYLAVRAPPQTPRDLADHRCIVHRHPEGGGYPWPFQENGRSQPARPEGALMVNDSDLVLEAAVAGLGIACVFEDRAAPLITAGTLVRLLDRWCGGASPHYALYYANRLRTPPALARFIEVLRTGNA